MLEPGIRPATLDDVPEMVALLAELFAIEADFHADPARQTAGLRSLLESTTAKAWVAESQGRAVGMITLQILISTAEGGEVGLVEDLVISVPWRRHGLGHRLIRTVEAWAWERGLSRLQLLADRENAPALDFYRKHEWTDTRLVALRKARE